MRADTSLLVFSAIFALSLSRVARYTLSLNHKNLSKILHNYVSANLCELLIRH